MYVFAVNKIKNTTFLAVEFPIKIKELIILK